MSDKDLQLGPSPLGDAPKWKDAAARLLKRTPADDYVAVCTAQIADPKTNAARAGVKAVVIFRIGKEWLGLPAELLQEIAEPCAIRTLPHQRGSVVKGVVNIRGELLACISLPLLLGMEGYGDTSLPELPAQRRLLVLNRDGGRFVFEADEVCRSHRYHPSELCAPPATLAKSSAPRFIEAILRWNENSVGCLAGEELRHALDRRLG